MPTMAEAQAYIDEQDLKSLLNDQLNQVLMERPADGAKRMAELLAKAAKEREDLTRMRTLFAKADTSGNGFIDIYELRAFLNHMDEPLAEPELQATFADIASEKGVDFAAFSQWYPSARARGGVLARKGDRAVDRKKRASRVSRASHDGVDDELSAAFDILGCRVTTVGEPNTLGFRVKMQYPDGGALLPEDGGGLKQISPWHDIPLYPPDGKAKVRDQMRLLIPLRSSRSH